MKKYLFYILLIALSFSVTDVKAYSESTCDRSYACAICHYEHGPGNLQIDLLIKSDGSTLSLEHEVTKNTNTQLGLQRGNITGTDFEANGKIKCLNQIYIKRVNTGTADRIPTYEYTKEGTSIVMPLNASKSYNNNKAILNSNSTSQTSSNTSQTNNTNQTPSTQSSNTSSTDPVTKTGEERESEDIGVEVTTCEGLIGDNVLSLLKNIRNLIMIAGPIIAIVLASYDLEMAMASGDDDARKKGFKRAKNRIIAAGLLILVPYILDLIINIISSVGHSCV